MADITGGKCEECVPDLKKEMDKSIAELWAGPEDCVLMNEPAQDEIFCCQMVESQIKLPMSYSNGDFFINAQTLKMWLNQIFAEDFPEKLHPFLKLRVEPPGNFLLVYVDIASLPKFAQEIYSKSKAGAT